MKASKAPALGDFYNFYKNNGFFGFFFFNFALKLIHSDSEHSYSFAPWDVCHFAPLK